VLYALGSGAGGLTCYLENGRVHYEYNLFILQRTKIQSEAAITPGRHTITVSTRYAEVRPGGPLDITVTVDGETVAAGQVPVSAPLLFTANDCLDIGTCLGSPVSMDYRERAPFPFEGHVHRVHVAYT
jgi:arylsulfatase